MASDLGRSAVTIKLTYLVSHPIQYQAPLLQKISREKGIYLRVIFERIPVGSGCFDPGFMRQVEWDVPLTDGYEHVLLDDTDLKLEVENSDLLWLHGWASPVMKKALLFAKWQGVPVFMRGENCDLAMPDGIGPKGWLKRLYIRWILRQCHSFLAIGTENRNYYLKRGVLPERIFMMPYAIDNESFATAVQSKLPDRNALKSQFGIGLEQKVVLFTGKFIPRKHPDLLLRAMNRIEWPHEKPALVFVGEGEMEAKLRALAPEAIFLGFKNQSELPQIYAMADVLVIPSQKEPWGLVANEAMACGTAVIVSDQVGCGPDLINEQCGKIFPAGDVDALSEEIVCCLEKSEKMGKAALARISKWSFSEDIDGLKQAINNLFKNNDNFT